MEVNSQHDPSVRSKKTTRTPPQKHNNSNVLDPEATNCQMCKDKDTIEMVRCDECDLWHHFKCVNVTADIVNHPWKCQKCSTTKSQEDFHSTRSGISSTSSRRRSTLLLEKLAREKAIIDKLAEERAKLAEEKKNLIAEKTKNAEDKAKSDAEYLEREFEIRDGMTDSEDEVELFAAGDQPQNGEDVVNKWLNVTDTSKTIRDIQLNQSQEVGLSSGVEPNQSSTLITSQPQIVSVASSQTTHLDNILGGNQSTLASWNVPPPRFDHVKIPELKCEFRSSDLITRTSSSETSTAPTMPSISTFTSSVSINNQMHQNSGPQISFPSITSRTQSNQIVQISGPPISIPAITAHIDTANQILQNSGTLISTPAINTSHVTTSSQILPNLEPQSYPAVNTAYTTASVNQNMYQRPLPRSQSYLSSITSTVVNDPRIQGQLGPTPSTSAQSFVNNSTNQSQGVSIYQSSSTQPPNFQNFGYQSTSQGQGVPIYQSSSTQPPNFQNFGYQSTSQGQGVPIYQSSNTQAPNFQQMQMPNMLNIYDPYVNDQSQMPNRLQIAARQAMSKEFPKFDGNPTKWSIFKDTIDNNIRACGLSNVEIMDRFEKCLQGPARKAVENLLSQSDAVPEVIDTLKMMFGRPEVIIDMLLKQIRNLPHPQMNKMETFIDFAISIRNVNSEIKKTGMWQHLYNPQLIQEIVDKLPYRMRLNWGEQKLLTPNVNFSDFSDWLYQKAKTACAVTLPSTRRTEQKSDHQEEKRPKSKSTSNGFVHAYVKQDQSTKKTSSETQKSPTNSTLNQEKGCQLCHGQSHQPRNCQKFTKMSYNEKWEIVKDKKWCRTCLGEHHTASCKSKTVCGESGCTKRHHRLLHNPTKTEVPVVNPTNNENVHSAHQLSKISILRRYIPVTLYGPKGSINVLAFLDEGSDMTLIEERIAEKLGINGVAEDLYLEWTSKVTRKEVGSKTISVEISGRLNPNKRFKLPEARTVKSLNLPAQTVDAEQLKEKYKFLHRIPIESYENETPAILIGLIDCKLSTPQRTRSGESNEPMAAKTLLGWEVHGATTQSTKVVNVNFHFNDRDQQTNNDEKLHQMIAQFFSLENFGVKKPEHTMEALTEKRAKQLLESTTKKIGNKFETGLLWKYENTALPESYSMAKRRLISLENRLQKDPKLSIKFRTMIAEYIEKGYVKKLSVEEQIEKSSKTWYLPLFPVVYPKKPDKVRPVWDAAAKVGEISLNSMLLSGPDQLVSLPGVLLRFRERKFAVTGDIKEMFHQILIRKEDQMSQRFLWREEGSSKIDTYALQVMSFGATCSPSSAQYIKNHNAREYIQQYPRAEKSIRENHYVDDWIESFDTVEETIEVANEVRYVHSMGGFEIRNCISNSSRVMSSLGENSKFIEQKLNFDLEEPHTERILGMWWNVSQDLLTYSLRYNPLNKEILTGLRSPTKREILRTLMSIYDPLGLLALFLIQLKMLLQDIWRNGIGWDDKLSKIDDDAMYERWIKWIKYLPEIEKIEIPRQYSTKIQAGREPQIELHVFVDASELAYATVAYLRIEDEEGVECCLIGGKTKVAPLKPLSIPRMEVLAGVLGARFKVSILENLSLHITRIYFWSDSTTVLSWLKSDLRKYSQFVGARVGEILETTSLNEWRWVPSKMNPAEDATKWKNSFSLDTNNRWFQGPDFLYLPKNLWPKFRGEIEETTEELKPKYVHAHIKVEPEILNIKFEKYHRWVRTQAFVLRFINNLKAKIGKSTCRFRSSWITREEYRAAENALYRKAQLDEFSYDYIKLQSNQISANGRTKSVGKRSQLYRYSPYIDYAGVLRVKGRIDAAPNVSAEQKRPIILPTHHQITDLIVADYHRRYKHQNTETVINEIKQKFTIPRLRALLKRIRRNCQYCKNASAMPIVPEMADLPIGRLSSFTRPFTHVGVDYAGPLLVVAFRKTVKVWIVLFTCLTIRAVHLEYATSLTSDSCIMAIRRFIGRRGTPLEFYSDQGTNLIGADNEHRREIEAINHDKIRDKVDVITKSYSKWNFNPPLTPHMGGVYERLVLSMKTTLYSIIPATHRPNIETLGTALIEVENIINSRPLTFVSVEPDDQEALTPNHFLLGCSNGNKPPGIFPPLPTTLRRNWRFAQQIADSFWRRWIKEYIPIITRRTKWFEDVKPIEVGDQVIITDEDSPRNTWTRGVVIETLKTGKDGRISKVKVRTEKSIYTRPVAKLAVLDIKIPGAKTLTG